MEKPLRDSHFKTMAILFKFRDFFIPRRRVLKEVGIKKGDSVLDFGCGPGGYIALTSELVGESGKVYALDHHPLAIVSAEKIIKRHKLKNVKTIKSEGGTGLSDSMADVILLYDIFHELKDPEQVLQELHRVLKPGGILSASDHHLKKEDIVSRITESGLFRAAGKGKKTLVFRKNQAEPESEWEAGGNGV